MSILIGKKIEILAEQFLISEGLTLVQRNYRCRMGEIDLIMTDREELIFVEVRHRKSPEFGGALESVTYSKQQKIWRTAQHYLLKHSHQNILDFRFDVICYEGGLNNPMWIPNAFSNIE